jgi:hypothetical protein
MKMLQKSTALCLFALSAGTALALGTGTPAQAQTTRADSQFLSDLYGFLSDSDSFAYDVATELGDETNVMIAQGICQGYVEGATPANTFTDFTNGIAEEARNQNASFSASQMSSLHFYVGSMMMLGSIHYCPDYQSSVEQALNSL